MAKKKRKRAQQRQPDSPIVEFVRRNPKWIRRIGILVGLVAVVAAIFFVANPFGSGPTAIDENGQEISVGLIDRAGHGANDDDLAPNFVLPNYDGRAVRLEDFEGKTVFLSVWASWCGPCKREMPSIIRIAEQHPDDVVVLAVNRGESQGTAENWTRSNNFREDLPNFHWLVDEREAVWRAYSRGIGMPQSFFLSGDGVVRVERSGELQYDEMVSSVEQALSVTSAFDSDS